MIAKLKGIVDGTGEGFAIIDVGGVGYLVFCSNRTLMNLAPKQHCELLIETHVREDHIHLYGFANEYEKVLFGLLTTVQGVGNKVALGILSIIAPEKIVNAIAAGDKAILTQAPGVGPKLAGRIVTELKEKAAKMPIMVAEASTDIDINADNKKAEAVSNVAATDSKTAAVENSSPEDIDEKASEAISALVNLGYGRTDAYNAVNDVLREEASLPLQDIISRTLKEFGKNLTQ